RARAGPARRHRRRPAARPGRARRRAPRGRGRRVSRRGGPVDRTTGRAFFALPIVALALAAAACGDSSPQRGPPKLPAPPSPRTITVATGAEPEGTLDVLAPPGAFPHTLIERFTRKDGCLVSLHQVADPGRVAGLLGPNGGPVDVVSVRSD